MSEVILSHYLVDYYTTHQPDGVHIEAQCTCGEKLESVSKLEQVKRSFNLGMIGNKVLHLQCTKSP
jgi:hypothetical protein